MLSVASYGSARLKEILHLISGPFLQGIGIIENIRLLKIVNVDVDRGFFLCTELFDVIAICDISALLLSQLFSLDSGCNGHLPIKI